VVSVILINEAFEYVAKGPFLILKMVAWKLCSLPYFDIVKAGVCQDRPQML
jgi:hypothetical protein